MSRHYVITISRQFGTGGREIGKALGAALGVPVYDRELLEEAARTYCIPVSVMERNDETAPSRVLESFALSAPSLSMLTGAVDYSTIVTSDTTFAWQSATIRRLAKEGPCVIIGRCADHVLRGTPGVVSLFLYADYEARVDHITQKYQLSRGDATILIDETEKERARYYKRHTGQEFARMENYDLPPTPWKARSTCASAVWRCPCSTMPTTTTLRSARASRSPRAATLPSSPPA